MFLSLSLSLRQLLELDLLERLAGDMISSQLLSTITSHVTFTCRDSYDQSRITQLEKVRSILPLRLSLRLSVACFSVWCLLWAALVNR